MQKLLFTLTTDEFIEVLREGLGFSTPNEKVTPNEADFKKHYVYGLKGLCSLLGCSQATAARIKKSGVIDAAISQSGKLIIIDADLVLDLLNVQKRKKNYNIRKGYNIK